MIEVKDLSVSFRTGPSKSRAHGQGQARARSFRAVDSVSFSIKKGEALGLVGESGSGKTTLGLALLRLLRPETGSVSFCGTELTALEEKALRKIRPRMQLLFQDPSSSLNPCMRIGASLEEALRLREKLSKTETRVRALELMDAVELEPGLYSRYPYQLSGGQNQRAALARALALEPDFLVADEPTSALDVSVQAQILHLLQKLRRERGLTLLFISHDLELVRRTCERVVVMHAGKIVEMGACEEVFGNPEHPYTKSLLFSDQDGALPGKVFGEAGVLQPPPVSYVQKAPEGSERRGPLHSKIPGFSRALSGIKNILEKNFQICFRPVRPL